MSATHRSEFELRVQAFYLEATRYGDHQGILRAGSTIAVIRDCRPQIEDRWADVAELLGGDAPLQLRLAVIAIRHLVALNRAMLIEMVDDNYESGVLYRRSIADGVDLLA